MRPRLWVVAVSIAVVGSAHGGVITLKNGVQLEGRVGKIGSLGENVLDAVMGGGEVQVKQIVLVDDDLRRTFVSQLQVQAVANPTPPAIEKLRVAQRLPEQGKRVASIGPILRVTPFDKFGRRVFSMQTAQGPIDVIQGITEITPSYTKVEGILTRNPYLWDMRVATSSLPRDVISSVVRSQINEKNADDRLRIVRFYIQAERYDDARVELEGVLKDFPELSDLQRQVRELHQAGANRLIKEIELRRESTQHQLAHQMLSNFPVQGIAGETLLKVRDMLAEYEQSQMQGKRVLSLLETHHSQIEDPALRERIDPVRREIAADLTVHTLDRFADYLRLADDEKLGADQKVALALSGWLLGSNSGTENVSVALSLVKVREAVRRYLRATRHHDRQLILQELRELEGSAPANLAKLLAHMKPAIETPTEPTSMPGLYELSVPGLAEQGEVRYVVQLPPEYHPYRRYPCIVTLNGAGTTPHQQIDWWAGSYREQLKLRLGQAARHGYIVVAPAWSKEHQRKYEFSAREHAAVLNSLRDACRRFSVDTDRVFLSGHSMGGDAAWDIGLAHPDLWAGVLPIVASSDKYVSRYWENGRSLPMYFVYGSLDGGRMATNARELDRYLNKSGYDVVVVEYQGRGHEDFQDEIHRLFAWMNLHRREFALREFTTFTMRPWDNYFWWAEFENYPTRVMVPPAAWPPPSGMTPAKNECKADKNRITIRSAASAVTVWLTPDLVNFDEKITLLINGKTYSEVRPEVETLLEDVRTRGDRQHPFWAKVRHDVPAR